MGFGVGVAGCIIGGVGVDNILSLGGEKEVCPGRFPIIDCCALICCLYTSGCLLLFLFLFDDAPFLVANDLDVGFMV